MHRLWSVSAFILCFLTGLLLASSYSYIVPVIWAGLALALVLLKKPAENFIILAIFLYPLLPFHFGIDPGKPLPVMKMHRMLLLAVFGVWFAKRGFHRIRISFRGYPLRQEMLFVFCTLLCTCLLNHATFSGYNYLISFMIESCLFSFMICDFFDAEAQQENLLKIICVSGAVVALVGIVERITHFNWYSLVPAYRDELNFAVQQQVRFDQNRVRGAFTHAISYGAALAILMTINLSFLFNAKKKLQRLLYFFSILLLLLGCYLSVSRGPMLMFLLMFIVMLSFQAKRCLFFIAVVGILVLAQPFYQIKAVDKLKDMIGYSINSQGTDEVSDSSYSRIMQFEMAQKFIIAKPLCGYGFRPFNNDLDETIDNFYLRYVLNFGFAGMFALIYLLVVMNKKALYVFNNSTTVLQKNVSLAMLATSIGIAFLWITVSLEEYMVYFWLLGGVITRMYAELHHRQCSAS